MQFGVTREGRENLRLLIYLVQGQEGAKIQQTSSLNLITVGEKKQESERDIITADDRDFYFPASTLFCQMPPKTRVNLT